MNRFIDRNVVSLADIDVNLEREFKQLLDKQKPSFGFDDLWKQHSYVTSSKKAESKRPCSTLAKWSIGIGTATVIGVGSLIGIGFASPEIAEALRTIPFFEYLYSKGVYSEDLQQIENKKLSSLANVSSLNHGIEFRMLEVYYDGIQIVLNYEVKYPDSAPKITEEEAAVNYNLNFEGLEPSWISTHDFIVTGDHTFIGTTQLSFSNTDLPDEMLLHMSVNRVGTTRGNWDVSFPLSTGKSEGLTKKFHPQVEFTFKGSAYTIEKLVFGPVTTQLVINDDYPQPEFNVAIEDDNGTILNSQGGDGGTLTYMYFNFSSLTELNPRPRFINLILSEIVKSNEENIQTKSIVDRKRLTDAYPIVLKGDEGGTVKVTNIDFKENQTIVYYEASKVMSQKTNLKLENREGETLFSREQPIRISGNSLSFKLVFPKMNKSDAAALLSYPYSYPKDIEMKRIQIPLDWDE